MINRILTRKTAYVLISILALYTVVGFFLAPWVVEKFLIKRWGHFAGRTVAIESVSFNPFTLSISASKISIREKNGSDFITARSLFADLSIASLFRLAPVCTRYEMDSPIVNLVLKQNNTFNFSDLMTPPEAKPANQSEPEQKIFGFSISNGKIINGAIHFSDQIRQKDHHIELLNLDLPFLSSLEKDRETRLQSGLDFVLNQAKIDIGLEALPFSPACDTAVTFKTGAIDLIPYLGYLTLPENLAIAQMETSFDLSVTYSQTRNTPSLILKGTADLANLDIRDTDHSPVLAVPHLRLTIAPSDLLNKRLDVSELKILSPKIHVSRYSDGNLNLFRYLPTADMPDTNQEDPKPEEKGAGGPEPGKQDPGFVFQLASGQISDASVFFTDAANTTQFTTTLSPVSIQVKQMVAEKRIQGEYEISLKTEADETLVSKGRFSSDPMEIEGAVTLEKLNIPKYTAYYTDFVNCDVREGQIRGDIDFLLSKTKTDLALVIHNKELGLTNLTLWDRINKETPIVIPELTLRDSMMDTGKQKLDLGKITTSQGKIILRRQADASINLVKNLIPPPAGPPEKKAITARKPSETDDVQKTDPAWDIRLDTLEMERFFLAFFDASTKEPASIDLSDIHIQANELNFSGTQKAGVDLEMQYNKSGKIHIKGDLIPSQLTAGLDLSLDKINVNSLQPYFTDQLNIAVTKGFIQTKGRLDLSLGGKGAPLFSYKGNASITDVESLEKTTDNAFFSCNSLYFTGMDISLFPVKVFLKDVALTDFYSRVIISDKGKINFRQILVDDDTNKSVSGKGSDTAAGKSNPGPEPEIVISNVSLQGGHIRYSDFFTQPNVTAEMKEIAGQIKGLSSSEGSMGEIQLRGLHGKSSPLEISGRISPLTPKRFFDVDISFKDIDLTRFSPYAAKYIGYKIEKGKLVLNLKYKIDGNKLESRNSLFLDQFTLGEKVKSEYATSLPVPLAISLLKNSKNQIDLNVPVTGDLNDPKFSLSGAFFGVFGNLIMKVVTAPFKFLGAMFGGGEELGYVNFDYGSDTPGDEEIQKLDQLIHILVEKKELKLDIIGTYDRNRDGQVLRENRYESGLKSEKLNRQKDKKGISNGEVTLLPEERESAVLAAYERADFSKPRNENGQEKEISTPEKEKLLLTHVDISENDLKELAMKRAETIKAYILSTEKVAPARLFLHDPHPSEEGADPQGVAKVNFLIK